MPNIILAARGGITTHFGEDIGRGFPHRGIDQGHGDGNAVDLEIRAPAAGKVIAVGRDGTYGLRIIILHDDFTVSLLAHHARQFVSVGDRVKQRQLIAEMGNTGTIYVHNHQEYRDKFGGQLDPLKHLSTAPVALDMTDLPKVKKEEDVIYPWVFITEDARIGGVWWKYDGRAKYMCAPGDPQLLVDLGLAAKVEVKLLGPRVRSIPTGTV